MELWRQCHDAITGDYVSELTSWGYIAFGLIFLWSGFVRSGLGFGGAALALPLFVAGRQPVNRDADSGCSAAGVWFGQCHHTPRLRGLALSGTVPAVVVAIYDCGRDRFAEPAGDFVIRNRLCRECCLCGELYSGS